MLKSELTKKKYVCLRTFDKVGVGTFTKGEIVSNEDLIELVKDDSNFKEIKREA